MTTIAQFGQHGYDLTSLATTMNIPVGGTNAVEAVINRLLIGLALTEAEINVGRPKENLQQFYSYRVGEDSVIVHSCKFPLAPGAIKISSGD